jgi:DNA-binding winged helix-turn-helix (wHTH) protein
MLDTLRGLRDSFKQTLCYVVGMRQEMIYLFDPSALGEMYEILDTHVCWVGAMDEPDARRLIVEETHTLPAPPTESDVTRLLALTGGYPALLKAACHWWASTGWASTADRPPAAEWADVLLAERSIQSRMAEIWAGLTQEERRTLSEVQKQRRRAGANLAGQYQHGLASLADKGLCRQTDAGWRISSDLFAAYVAGAEGQSNGKIWLDESTDELYQGQTLVGDLSPLGRAVLHFLVRHPRARHAKTDLIISAWPDELRRLGVTDDSLYQIVRELRKKIEPDPAKPCYIVTWRGRPEGGYQFFPEGKPG